MTDPGGIVGDLGTREAARQERFARVKAIFVRIIDLPRVERDRAAAEACGSDDALLLDVRSLLEGDDRNDSFLEQPAIDRLAPEGPSLAAASGPQLQPGSALGSYVVEALLGSGGMGEVYLARDTRLRRRVAIKIVGGRMPGERADVALLREARHASVLSHPGICAVHEVGEHAGRPFIVMEHVDGETLHAIVARRGALPWREVLGHGARIADALAHAHERGVVHRDLKSANVMVTGHGVPTILDFGLARWLPNAEARRGTVSFATETLALAGTLDYMAPEVLLGEAADSRSDIWSLGVLLFETAAGTRPFRRTTPVETASAVLKAEPPALPRAVPLGLRLVIRKCLARDPRERYQRASDVRDALDALGARGVARHWLVAGLAWTQLRPRVVVVAALLLAGSLLVGTGAWLTSRVRADPPRAMRSLLVMPLGNPDGNADQSQRYFADGLTEALIADMGETGVGRVISRTSAMKVAHRAGTPREIARELGVDGVLEGTVSRRAGTVILSVRLLDGATGHELWAASRERPERETSALVGIVAAAVAAGMHHALTEEAARRLLVDRAVAPEVYEAYL
jgi:TolB-like protein/tRNA A-37 threonylcarbamoyl transferase component Bud32